MKSKVKSIFSVFFIFYIITWVFIVPYTHKEMLVYGEKGMGDPVEITSKENLKEITYYMPYVRINSNVIRHAYDKEKTPVKYKEENLSIVIPIFPFVAYYYQKYTSGGHFNFGTSGYQLWFFGKHYKYKYSEWIT